MRTAALVMLLLLAGCSAPNEDDSAVEAVTPETPAAQETKAPKVPANFSKEIAYLGAFEVVGAVAGHCSAQEWCFDYPFVITDAASIQATLAWSIVANDLDLLLLKGDTVIHDSSARTPDGREGITSDLEPGKYTLRVVPYVVINEPDALLTATYQPK